MNYETRYENDLKPRLEKLAYQQSRPFCYGCYIEAPSGRCPKCLSDDLMRLVPGDGCEYGIDWVVHHLIEANLNPVDTEAGFEESISDCYPETTKVGWMELDTVTILKQLDPISWGMAESEWVDSQVEDGELVRFDNGSSYYRVYDIESYLDQAEDETKRTA
jgi:hypothetical protein